MDEQEFPETLTGQVLVTPRKAGKSLVCPIHLGCPCACDRSTFVPVESCKE